MVLSGCGRGARAAGAGIAGPGPAGRLNHIAGHARLHMMPWQQIALSSETHAPVLHGPWPAAVEVPRTHSPRSSSKKAAEVATVIVILLVAAVYPAEAGSTDRQHCHEWSLGDDTTEILE
jgi:hypothetical protein